LALQRAAQHATDDAKDDIHKLTSIFLQRKKAYEQTSKQMYQKAFAAPPEDDATTATATTTIASKDTTTQQEDPTNDTDATTTTTTTTTTATTTTPSSSSTGTMTYLWNNEFLWNYLLPYGFQIVVMMTFLWIFMTHSNILMQPNPQDTFAETATEPPQQRNDEF